MASRAPLTLNFACVICMEHKQSSFASPAISPSCFHPSNICKPCLQTYIEVALSSSTTIIASPRLKCPQCPNVITLEYVQEAFPTLAPTYSDSLLQRYLRSIPEYRPCQKPSCPGGQLHSSKDKQPIVTCLMCSAKSCFTCRIPWHASRTCSEVKSEHGANKELLGKLTKACPGCGALVEKVDGCDHLRCRCDCEWCWVCRANYVVIRAMGNEGHGKTCPHWRGPAGEEAVAPSVELGRPRQLTVPGPAADLQRPGAVVPSVEVARRFINLQPAADLSLPEAVVRSVEASRQRLFTLPEPAADLPLPKTVVRSVEAGRPRQFALPEPATVLPPVKAVEKPPRKKVGALGVPQCGQSFPVPQREQSFPVPQRGQSFPVPQCEQNLPAPQRGQSFPVPQCEQNIRFASGGSSLGAAKRTLPEVRRQLQ